MNGELIPIESEGHTFHGYLASSKTGSGPGIVVLQEWWGLVGHIQNVVDRFAEAGFTALAPDLYGGTQTTDPDEAATLMMALNIARTETILRGAIRHLLSLESVSSQRAGAVGFCMGGQLSLYAACENPEIGACVDYYGIHPDVHPALENLRAPVLGFFAEHDEYASPASVEVLRTSLEALGKPHEFITYPGTHHAFFNDDRPAYNAAAATDTWNRMTAFFQETLRPNIRTDDAIGTH